MKRSLIYSLILLIISFILIFFNFNLIPKNISFDEIAFTKLALSLNDSNYIPYSNLATGHSTLYFYIILASFKIFGVSNFALRLPSAIFGILSILVFFVLLKNVFKEGINPYFSFLGAFILSTSRWFINFSRFSFEATFLLFVELLSLLFILLFIKKKNNLFLLLSGIFAGLSFLSYTPGRIFFLIPLVFLLLNRVNFKKVFFFIVIFLIISSSLIFYLISNKDTRVNTISIISQNISTPLKISMISSNIQKTALMFNVYGDINGRHNFPGKPALNPILGALFILGIILSTKNIHDYRNKLFLFYFLLSTLPTLLTIPQDNPNMLRTFTQLPSIAYFITYAIKHIVEYPFRINKKVIYILIIGIVLISSYYELNTYFKYQSRVFKNSFEVKCNIKEVLKFEASTITKKCLVSKNEF